MTKLAFIQPSRVNHWAPEFLQRVKNELSQPRSESQPTPSFQVVDDVAQADTVLYLDSTFNKKARDLADYRKLLEWAVEHRKTVFTLNYEDRPLGVMPGIYTSVDTQNFDASLHFSWPHLEPPNDKIENMVMRPPEEPKHLFAFAGSCSHNLRRKLITACKATNESGVSKVYEVDRWFDHTPEEHQQYVKDILDCRFALCPRGLAPYSHRILESILLHRVPVIIADDWIPFSFPADNYYVQVAEKDLDNIHGILQQEMENYDTYYANLLKLKSTWLTKGNRYQLVVEKFLKFHRRNQRAHDPQVLLERLASEKFLKSNGLLPHQQLFRSAARLSERGKKILGQFMPSYTSISTQKGMNPLGK